MRTRQDIEQTFPGSSETGLTPEQAAESERQFGQNRLTPLPREPLWKKFLANFEDPIIKILLAAALLSMFVELFKGHGDNGEGGNPLVAGIALGVVAAVMIALLVLRQGRWIPSMMFVSAFGIFILGLIVGIVAVEGLAVMIAVVLATGVAFAMEYKSDQEFEVLNAQKESLKAKVVRSGDIKTVSLEEVVVGDLVFLEMGDEIPADGRLSRATDLYVDQSLMTGESEPVHKRVRPPEETEAGPDQMGCVYRGTQVVDGVGYMVVAEVGDNTAIGQIARRLSGEEEEEETVDEQGTRVKHKLTISKELTPLQLKLQHLAELISKVGYAAAILIFLALFVRGMFFSDPLEIFWPTSTADVLTVASHLLDYFVYMVIIIVVAVPEGLPMSVTVSLALAMRKMTRANSLVRQLVACETVGSATVICSDKTGTLTQNKMQVVRLFWDGKTHDRGQPEWVAPDKEASWPRDGKPIDWMVLNSAANSTANLEEKEGRLITVGNSTEGALLNWVKESGLEYRKIRAQFEPLYELHFSSERKRMTTVIRYGDRLVSLVKGAPERVLDDCTHYQTEAGTAEPMNDEVKNNILEWIRDSASQAMRTLAFAYANLPEGTPEDEDSLHERVDQLNTNLTFIGCVAIRDPLREDVKAAVEVCRQAGIEAKMITGDNVETARAIANDIDLVARRDDPIDSEDGVIFTHDAFTKMYDRYQELRKQGDGNPEVEREREAIQNRLSRLRVLARAQPLDKFKMVSLLQERNEVVAVTGDGTNDAPALKKADVGLAMGITGTEVAKEASKIVLLDDAFSTIVKAVHWGRSLYENIQRFIQFQLTINVSALTIAFLGPFFNIRPPFTVLQLLWINVIMDTFAAIALCSEPPRPGVMEQKPKRKDENILTPAMIKTILTTGAFFVVVMMGLLVGMQFYKWFAGDGDPLDQYKVTSRQISIFFSVYVFFQVWNQINCRSLVPDTSGFSGILKNPMFLFIAGTIAVVQVLIISIPPLAMIFIPHEPGKTVEPLSWMDWLVIIAATSSVLIFAEIVRFIQMSMKKTGSVASTPTPEPTTAQA